MRVKRSGLAPGLANARSPGGAKFANAPSQGGDKAGKCPAVARGRGGGSWLGTAGIDWCITLPKYEQPTPSSPLPDSDQLISTIWSSFQFITWEWFRTLHKFLHEVQTIRICFYDCDGDIIFVSDDIHAKIPQKLNYESKKIQILGESGINSKLKHRKAHNSIL